MPQEKTFKSFDDFTNLYELQKTLRFELKPTEKTRELIKKNKVFEKDQTIDDSYNQAKFYFNEMHREFINNSLANISPGIVNPLIYAFAEKERQEQMGNKKDSNGLWEKARKSFCLEIAKIFVAEDKKIKEEYDKKTEESIVESGNEKIKVKFLLSAKVLGYLKEKFPEAKNDEFINKKWPSLYVDDLEYAGQKKYVFSSFEKFTTYLGKFQATRKNLYVTDDKATSVASRILDNFVIFQGNKNKFENKLNKLSIFSEEERSVFKQKFYVNCFIQNGIDKYNEIVGGLNKKIKESRDKEATKAKRDKLEFKKNNYPLFVVLDKQILGQVEKEGEIIEKEDDLKKVFLDFITDNNQMFKQARKLVNELCGGNFIEEYEKIYLQKKVLNTISRKWFSDANSFELLLPQTSGKKDDKNTASIKKYTSLANIKIALEKEENANGLSGDVFRDKYYDDKDGLKLKRGESLGKRFGQFLKIWKFEFDNLFRDKELSNCRGYDFCLEEAEKINWAGLSRKDRKEVERVKQYSDISLDIYQMIKYFFLGSGKDVPLGSELFYGEFNAFYQIFEFIRYYNALRNYITKKAFNPDKIKLNFENPQLLGGWDKNKEKEKFGIVIRKNGVYYLAVLTDQYKKIFEKIEADTTGDFYEKMNYKFFPDPKRMIPKIAFATKNISVFKLTEEIKKIKREYENFQKDKKDTANWEKSFNKGKCSKLIRYYQDCLEIGGYKKEFGLTWKKPEEYSGVGSFNDHIEKQNYKVFFQKVSTKCIDDYVDNGKMYLFQIYSKDFSERSCGKGKNIHTLYFTNLFSPNNLNNPILKLSGGAEIFHRTLSISKKEKIITQKNQKILEKGEKAFRLNRYSEDKIFIHIPIKINRGETRLFNQKLNSAVLFNNKSINIIGIDRGEKNLLYYSVINQKGEILDQGSLNEINGINYFAKLHWRAKEREADRKSWNQVEQIKDLKKGYLSAVVHKICVLIIEYNAIVVLEDLNMRFKQIRGGIEKSVYQQFEKSLIDKLGYMVFKDREPEEVGGVLKGYQLAARFESFEKMYKQTGILFYTQADYTSVTDPVSGFRKNIYIGNSWSQEKIKKSIDRFESIKWDSEIGSYAFTYDPADFIFENYKKSKKRPQEIISREWTVYSKTSRIERFKNESGYWEYGSIDLNKEFEKLFQLWDFDPRGDILSQIREKESVNQLIGYKLIDKKERDFYHRFIYLFNIILQLRNSFSKKAVKDKNGNEILIGDDIDFIASPVYPFFQMEARSEKEGIISKLNLAGFDKRIISGNKDKIIKTLDADANGAYNIARKGIITLGKIKKNPEKPDLFITKNEWDKFTQKDWQEK